jgi:hypothetical protein
MKKSPQLLLTCFFLLLISLTAHAEPIFAIGQNLVFETSSDGRSFDTRQPLSVRGGYRFSEADVYLEYSRFQASTGGQSMVISREHQETIIWGRKIFRPDWIVAPYLAMGGGVEWELVNLNFGSQSINENGFAQMMAAVALGARVLVWSNFDLQLEGRLSLAPDYNPNLLPALGVVAGFSF